MAESPVVNAKEISVTDLAAALKRTLEDRFGFVRVRGEISGYRGPQTSGHAYFSLKDAGARIDAVIWKGTLKALRVKPEEGMEVIALGRITTFPGRSVYQIIVESLEPAGIGALMALLDERRKKLLAEGLFAAERKRKIPFLPAVIGVVTSPTGAVIRDILHRLADRFPLRVLVWPVRVQGEGSADEVARAIDGFGDPANARLFPRPDVLIVARGGGSLEDLWGFNEEAVVRAVARSPIPVISAVGHETDVTLIDHVADLRAPTPTAAAEMAVPVRAQLLADLAEFRGRLVGSARRLVERKTSELRSAARALPTPDAVLQGPRQRLDRAASALRAAMRLALTQKTLQLSAAARRSAALSPRAQTAAARARWEAASGRLVRGATAVVEPRSLRLEGLRRNLARALDAGFRRRSDEFAAFGRRWARAKGEAPRRFQGFSRDLERTAASLKRSLDVRLKRERASLTRQAALLTAYDHRNVLARGFSLVRDGEGVLLRATSEVKSGRPLRIEFADGIASATGGSGGGVRRKKPDADDGQSNLF